MRSDGDGGREEGGIMVTSHEGVGFMGIMVTSHESVVLM